METHIMAMRDESDRLYHGVVIAPDHQTARRLFAKQMLEEIDQSLGSCSEKSLDEYAPASALEQDWRAEGSQNCCSCGCGRTRPLENREMSVIGISPILYEGKAHVCLMCAATWISTGAYSPLREDLEREAEIEINSLDDFEAQSLEECFE